MRRSYGAHGLCTGTRLRAARTTLRPPSESCFTAKPTPYPPAPAPQHAHIPPFSPPPANGSAWRGSRCPAVLECPRPTQPRLEGQSIGEAVQRLQYTPTSPPASMSAVLMHPSRKGGGGLGTLPWDWDWAAHRARSDVRLVPPTPHAPIPPPPTSPCIARCCWQDPLLIPAA